MHLEQWNETKEEERNFYACILFCIFVRCTLSGNVKFKFSYDC